MQALWTQKITTNNNSKKGLLQFIIIEKKQNKVNRKNRIKTSKIPTYNITTQKDIISSNILYYILYSLKRKKTKKKQRKGELVTSKWLNVRYPNAVDVCSEAGPIRTI